MERKINHDDFDEFLKENADGLRMHPSDRVWQNISRELDSKKRRFSAWFALSLLLLSGAYVTYEIGTTNRHELAHQRPAPVFTPVARTIATRTAANVPTTSPAAIAAAQTVQEKSILRQSAKNRVRRQREVLLTPNLTGAPENETVFNENLTTATTAPSTAAVIAEVEGLEITDYSSRLGAEPVARLELPQPVVTHEVITNPQRTAPAETSAVAATQAPTVLPNRKAHRLSWQIFATPTISYRVLSDNKNYRRPLLTPNIPANFSALYGINDAVIHKPDLGLEFGVMARYALSKSVHLRTGFQFNVSRYDIKAFSYVPEVATIALNNGFWVDSVRAISNYRNFAGGRTNWLQNFYFQASMPIGLEVKVAGNKRMHWGLASSIQPTYLVGNRSYMITADYKNYARVPWLSRRWNMNTSFETFVSINSGKTQWQVGPQVRYQVLSSFIREYPVKENLFDFGLKVGLTLK